MGAFSANSLLTVVGQVRCPSEACFETLSLGHLIAELYDAQELKTGKKSKRNIAPRHRLFLTTAFVLSQYFSFLWNVWRLARTSARLASANSASTSSPANAILMRSCWFLHVPRAHVGLPGGLASMHLSGIRARVTPRL